MNSNDHSRATYLVGGAPFQHQNLNLVVEHPGKLVAVDGGANSLPVSLVPDFIVGDLDSLTPKYSKHKATHLIHIAEQDTTDFEKAVSFCLENNFRQPFVCIGFVGGRFDQTLTILHICCRFPDAQFVFITDQDTIATLPLGVSNYQLVTGDRLSLYPLSACEFTASYGLLYPLHNLHMSQGTAIGTSNQVVGENVQIDLKSGSCFLIVDQKNQKAVLKALTLV